MKATAGPPEDLMRHGMRRHLLAADAERSHVTHLPGSVHSPTVSVIVPTYNSRDLLLKAVDALHQQQGVTFELIIVDDGSRDGSFEAVRASTSALGLAGKLVRLPENRGIPTARNVGLLQSTADFIAFTDADCLPQPTWLQAGLAAFTRGVGVVQGRVEAPPQARPPFLSRFIEISRLDGTFATCNAFYRREAVLEAGGFDTTYRRGSDGDLGARVLAQGWHAAYARDALVHHQVLPQTLWQWMTWPRHLGAWPKWTSRYPSTRRFLFAGYWSSWRHAALTAAIVGFLLARVHAPAALLAVPYLATFGAGRGLTGKFPLGKAVLHCWSDVFGWFALLLSSIRHRSLVL